MLFDFALPLGLCKCSNSCVMKSRNGVWRAPTTVWNWVRKIHAFPLISWYCKRSKQKKSQNPTKNKTQPPQHTLPHPLLPPLSPALWHVCKNQRLEGTSRVQLVQPSLQADEELGTLSSPLVTPFFPLLVPWWRWGVPVGHPHQCRVRSCHCCVVHSLRKPSDVGQYCSQFSWGTETNYTSKFSPNVRPIS